jgi:hypothetical protein
LPFTSRDGGRDLFGNSNASAFRQWISDRLEPADTTDGMNVKHDTNECETKDLQSYFNALKQQIRELENSLDNVGMVRRHEPVDVTQQTSAMNVNDRHRDEQITPSRNKSTDFSTISHKPANAATNSFQQPPVKIRKFTGEGSLHTWLSQFEHAANSNG